MDDSLITTRDLGELGFGESAIRNLVRREILARRHRGVYVIGDAPFTFHRKCRAAQLAIGPKGGIGHHTALVEHLMRPPDPRHHDVHVVVEGRGGRERREHLVVHRPLTLPPADIEDHDGFRVTTPTRTLLDTASALPRYARLRALEAAEHHLLHLERHRLDLHPSLKQALYLFDRIGARTKSDAEAMFLFICLDFGIPLPLVNHIFHGIEFDFRWPHARLIVELDGYVFHDGAPRGRERFESDREKGLKAAEIGYDFARISARQVMRQRARVARAVQGRLRP